MRCWSLVMPEVSLANQVVRRREQQRHHRTEEVVHPAIRMQQLFTPWRYSYIVRSSQEPECFFCAAAREPEDADRDGKPHRIQVKVDARNSNVRSRASVLIPKKAGS